ncbi:MAG: hypothetical protein E5W82_05275 [Mesorhizobium sp.]|nr:MAG: hypothetical protein E5W82_05275 [Mesorhizobium sp.]
MHDKLTGICATLDEISVKMEEANNTDTRLSQSQNWHSPPITPRQLAALPRYMAEIIRGANVDEVSEADQGALTSAQSALSALLTDTLPNLYSQPQPGAAAYLATISYAQMLLGPVHGWVAVPTSALPSALARKLNKAERDLAAIVPDQTDLENKTRNILEAHDAAEALPTTLQELKATLNEVRQASASSSQFVGKIEENDTRARSAVETLQAARDEGQKLVSQVSEQYRIATTVGLAAAFDTRAAKLNGSLYLWVGGLTAALLSLMVVGAYRLSVMREALTATPFDSSRVWVQIVLSILSVAAPIWFAWIATKQISQRFRLAEDYAFKASVAKAYEGYRREAVRIDPEFEKALFASALSRLDEAPLRLLEMSTHGSPLHELANSKLAGRLLDRVNGSRRKAKSNGAESPEASAAGLTSPQPDAG